MNTLDLIKDVIGNIENDLNENLFVYEDDKFIHNDHTARVEGYLRQLKLILKVEESKPQIAQPVGYLGDNTLRNNA